MSEKLSRALDKVGIHTQEQNSGKAWDMAYAEKPYRDEAAARRELGRELGKQVIDQISEESAEVIHVDYDIARESRAHSAIFSLYADPVVRRLGLDGLYTGVIKSKFLSEYIYEMDRSARKIDKKAKRAGEVAGRDYDTQNS